MTDSQAAVLVRDIEYIKKAISKIEDRLEKSYVTSERFSPLEDRVKSLEDNRRWAAYLIIGSVIVGLLALLGLK